MNNIETTIHGAFMKPISNNKLEIIKEIAGSLLRWTRCSDQDGNRWKEPYLKCYNKDHAEKDIKSFVDLYEDEDGDDDYGRPIIRKIYSVKIK
jgi:hypothetical protein